LSLPLPDKKMIVKENGKIIWDNNTVLENLDGIKFDNFEENHVNFTLGSGFYQFTMESKDEN